MESIFYKKRKGKMISGVLAGLSDKFSWDLNLARILAVIFMYFSGFGIFLYIVLAIFLPYKEDMYEDRHSTKSRKRKDIEPIQEDNDWFF